MMPTLIDKVNGGYQTAVKSVSDSSFTSQTQATQAAQNSGWWGNAINSIGNTVTQGINTIAGAAANKVAQDVGPKGSEGTSDKTTVYPENKNPAGINSTLVEYKTPLIIGGILLAMGGLFLLAKK